MGLFNRFFRPQKEPAYAYIEGVVGITHSIDASEAHLDKGREGYDTLYPIKLVQINNTKLASSVSDAYRRTVDYDFSSPVRVERVGNILKV